MSNHLDDYQNIRERDLKREGIFIGEGRYIVERMLKSGWKIKSILCADDLADGIAPLSEGVCPVLTLSRAEIAEIAGFEFHRGVLACGVRPDFLGMEEYLARYSPAGSLQTASTSSPGGTLVLCQSVTNMENLGSIYRTAAAFDVDAIILGRHCADPLSRKSIKVSVGAVFALPTIRMQDDITGFDTLKKAGYAIAGTGLADSNTNLMDFKRPEKIVLALGNEADGLPAEYISRCDSMLKIPISAAVDSLNVGVAAGIVLYEISTARK